MTPPPVVTVLGGGDGRWPAALSTMRHDVYHLQAFARFAAEHQATGEPVAFVVESGGNRLFVPLIVRDIPREHGGDGRSRDATSPRGYPGPILRLADDRLDGSFLGQAIDLMMDAMRSRDIISAFIRLHPFLSPPPGELEERGTLVEHGESASIDLRRTPDELWRQTRSNHRRDIRRAQRGGIQARIDDQWERFQDFVDAYDESMARRAAAQDWRLGRDHLEALRRALGERLLLCVVEDGAHLMAGALLTETDGIVEYHLSGTFDAFVRASPSKLLIHFATGWGQERGNRIFHLAGSTRRDDSVMHFKTGFGRETWPVRSWRLVVDPEAYARLGSAWSRRAGTAPDPPHDFFPAYRKAAPVGNPAASPGH